jgi:hypothetical protein
MKMIVFFALLCLVSIGSLWSQMIDNEGFEGATFPPAGWNIVGSVTRATPLVGNPPPSPLNLYGTYSALLTEYTQGLIAPKMANPYTLTLSSFQIGNGLCAPLFFHATTLAGPWTQVDNFTNISNEKWTTQTVSVGLTNVFLKIAYRGPDGGQGTDIQIDRITITPADFLFKYRTIAGGNWSDPAIWEYTRDDGLTWYAANIPPSSTGALTTTVRSGHTVTVTSNATVDEVVVETGASLTINSGITLTLNNGTNTDLAMNGTLINTGTLAFNTGATMTAGASSSITYNASTSQALGTGFPATVNNFTINNSAGVTMNGSVAVNGALTMTAGSLATGTNTLTVNNTATFSSTATVTGTGSFVLASGATLTTANTAGITSSGATGSVQTTTRSFSSGANYAYNGGSAQVTGNGLPATVNNLTVNNSAGVSLTGSLQVNGALTLTTGLSIGSGNTLTINGTVAGSGGLTGGTSSNLSITGTGSLYMPAVSTLNNFTVNRTGTTYLGSNLTVGGALALSTDLNLNGYTLTVNGTTPAVSGTLIGGGTSSIVVGGTSSVTMPAITSGLQNFTNNNTNSVTMGSAVTVSNSFVNNGILDVLSYGISGAGTGLNNGTIIAAIPNPISTNTYNQAEGSIMEFISQTTLPSGFTYQNLVLNSTATLFSLSGDITINETFSTANGASLDLLGYTVYFPFKYVSVAGIANITAFDPETYPEIPGIVAVNRKWTFTGSATGNPTVYLHWDNEQGVGVDFSNGSAIWRHDGSTWVKLGVAGAPVVDTPTRMKVGFPAAVALGGKADVAGQYAVTGNDETLPVELSSFTAVINAYNHAQLKWVTQTETNCAGFNIYRGRTQEFQDSELLDVFIPATNTSQTQSYMFTDTELTEDGVYYYWLANLNLDGNTEYHGPIQLAYTAYNGNTTPQIPNVSGISNLYPNPFNPMLNIEYGIKSEGNVKIEIYNLRGQMVRNYNMGYQQPGTKRVQWDGKSNNGQNCSSGVYTIRLSIGKDMYSRKTVLSK